MKGQYIILDLNTMEYFKDIDGKLKYFEDEDMAIFTASMYELPNAWICKLIYNHIEKE